MPDAPNPHPTPTPVILPDQRHVGGVGRGADRDGMPSVPGADKTMTGGAIRWIAYLPLHRNMPW